MSALLCSAAFVAALSASPAGAVLARVDGHSYGLTPLRGVNAASLPAVRRALASSASPSAGARGYDTAGQLLYHGGPVMHSVTTHVIYWDPSGEFTATTKAVVSKFFTDVAHDSGHGSNVFGVAGQYKDSSGHSLYSSTFGGEETDKTAYPTSGCTVPAEFDTGPPYTHCITDEQLQSELVEYLEAHGLPAGLTQQYFVLFPHKVVTCLPEESGQHPCSNNFYCAYHSSASSLEGEVIYSDMPFSLLDSSHAKACQFDENSAIQNPNGDTAGTNEGTRYADVALKVTSHEYNEASTDPLGDAWWGANGEEIGDKCNTTGTEEGEDPSAFLPTLGGLASSGTLFDQSINGDGFYLQSEWDNAAKACLMEPKPPTAVKQAASTSSGTAGTAVKFTASATDIYGGAHFRWNFGDGTEGSGATVEHVYGAPGGYEVTLTASDEFTGASAASVVEPFVVDEPPVAAFALEPNPAALGTAVKFDAKGSADPDGSIASYAWSFGDGAVAAGVQAEHSYAAAGSYTVTLTVTDTSGHTATVTHSVTVTGTPAVTATVPGGSTPGATTPLGTTPLPPVEPAPPTSAFTSAATFNATTGAIGSTVTVAEAGTLKWLLTFQNGKFGVFAASTSKCKKGFVRLGGRCRPIKVVFARGSTTASAPGRVKLVIKPTAAGLKALKNALKQGHGVPVTFTLTFQSARGGSAVTHTRVVVVKLKRH